MSDDQKGSLDAFATGKSADELKEIMDKMQAAKDAAENKPE